MKTIHIEQRSAKTGGVWQAHRLSPDVKLAGIRKKQKPKKGQTALPLARVLRTRPRHESEAPGV